MVWENPLAPFRTLLSDQQQQGTPWENGALAEARRAKSDAFLQEIQLWDIKKGGLDKNRFCNECEINGVVY